MHYDCVLKYIPSLSCQLITIIWRRSPAPQEQDFVGPVHRYDGDERSEIQEWDSCRVHESYISNSNDLRVSVLNLEL